MLFSTSTHGLDGISDDPSAVNHSLQLAAWQEHRKHCTIAGLRPEDLHIIEEGGLGNKAFLDAAYEASAAKRPPSPNDEEEVAQPRAKAPQAVDIRYVCMCQSSIAVRMQGGHVQVDEGSEELLATAKDAAESGPVSYQGNWSASGSSYKNHQGGGSSYSTETVQGGYR